MAISGLAYWEFLDVEWVASTELNVRRLLFGCIDAFPEEARQITHHPKPILENQSFLRFPANGPDTERLWEVFNKRLQTFRENGRYNTYFETKPQASLNNLK